MNTNTPEQNTTETSAPVPQSMPRREFLGKTATAAAAALAGAAAPVRAASAKGAQKRLGVGFIGCGGRSASHFAMVAKLAREMPIDLVACCDIYRPRLEKRMSQYGIKKGFRDHRKLLEDPAVDIVCIATPDHHHAPQAIDAVKAGKHVYCEKPITHWSQLEAVRDLADAVAASKTAFVCGTQAMTDPVWRQMKELIDKGAIGKPLMAEVGFFRIGDWGERGMPVDDPNAKPGPDLDWDAFLAPDRKKVPFSTDRFFRWRMFLEYAGGPVTDLYPHSLAQVVYMLGLGFPKRVCGLGDISRYRGAPRTVPDTFDVIAQYPDGFNLTLSGTQTNDYETTTKRGAGQHTPVIRGWDATLYISPDNKEIICQATQGSSRSKRIERFPIKGRENNQLLWKNLIQCALDGRTDTWSPMDLAYRTQTLLQMGMASHLHDKTVRFDTGKREIIL